MESKKINNFIKTQYENGKLEIKEMILILSQLIELERLAEIGEATEKAFEDGKYITDASCKTLSNADDLVEWAVEND